MLHDLLSAIALLLIIEGLVPGIAPSLWQKYLREVSGMNPRMVRTAGIASMLGGALLLQFMH
jgi:hypothetical protein